MIKSPRDESTTLTIRVGAKQKQEWQEKARRAGMSLTLFVSYVMDRTDLTVTMTTSDSGSRPPPRR